MKTNWITHTLKMGKKVQSSGPVYGNFLLTELAYHVTQQLYLGAFISDPHKK